MTDRGTAQPTPQNRPTRKDRPTRQDRSGRFAPHQWVVQESDRRMLLIVGVVATIVVAMLAWSGRGQTESDAIDSAADGSASMLVANPEIVYQTTLDLVAERVWVLGAPERLAVGSSAADGTQGAVTVLDGAGAALWRASFENGFTAAWVDDDLLVTTPGGSGGYQLSLLDGRTGAELWRVPLATAEIAYHEGALYAFGADRVSMIDRDTGAIEKAIEVYAAPTSPATMEQNGRFYDVGPASIQPVSSALETLGAPIPAEAGTVYAPFENGTLIATDNELIRYDLDGVEQGRWPTPVAGIESLIAVNGSLWLATHGPQITAIELGDNALSSWSAAGTIQAVVSDDESGYVAVDSSSNRHALYRADSGVELVTSGAPVHLVDNGYYLQTGSRLRAYSLPGQDILYDSGTAPGQSTFVIDGAYVLLSEKPVTAGQAGVEITVLS